MYTVLRRQSLYQRFHCICLSVCLFPGDLSTPPVPELEVDPSCLDIPSTLSMTTEDINTSISVSGPSHQLYYQDNTIND